MNLFGTYMQHPEEQFVELCTGFQLLTTIMARHKKQRQGKNDANTGKVPQEVEKDKSSLKSVGDEDYQHRWHHSV